MYMYVHVDAEYWEYNICMHAWIMYVCIYVRYLAHRIFNLRHVYRRADSAMITVGVLSARYRRAIGALSAPIERR